ncbi:MAG: hypothetical protein HBSAPP03_21700 [Phycisphaerae bacterium]|nr:MAG: hypothetical protein HBSAPP03_21700 [Phycisphaerae bacterium]
MSWGVWGVCVPAMAQDSLPPPKAAPPEGVPMAGAPVDEPLTAGAEVDVYLRDGRRETGFFVEQTKSQVTVSINGVRTSFPAESVERIARLPSLDERYRMLRDAIDPTDAESIVRLAEWLRGKGRLDLALWEVERALLIEPGNTRGKDLKVEIIAQQKVNEAKRPRPDPAAPVDPGPPKFVFPLLTPDQINIIKVYEVDLRDPPSMLISADATRKFLAAYAGREVPGLGTVPTTPEAKELFVRQRPADILAWFFGARARELYGQVRVRESPRAMRLFVQDVHNTWLINSCATAKCHGGEEAGRLWLTNLKAGTDAAAYTNFLILDRFRTADGKGLIDYEQPEKSPLLDFAIPREQAVFKHPEVSGVAKGKWRPALTGRDDDRYRRAVEWIRAMYRPRTGYPVEYDPPTPRAAKSAGDVPPDR